MKKLPRSVGLVCLLNLFVFGQQVDFSKERRFFDFLIGEWQIQNVELAAEKWSGGKDTFKFARSLDGNAITSEWYFNRGTPSKPDLARALYNMGFDNRSQSWTFYYVSPQSAQFYQGKYEDDNWYFYKTYTDNGKAVVERQNWRLTGGGLLQRTIESSGDDGKTWTRIYQGTLKKK